MLAILINVVDLLEANPPMQAMYELDVHQVSYYFLTVRR
jgi:hypothetical protein